MIERDRERGGRDVQVRVSEISSKSNEAMKQGREKA